MNPGFASLWRLTIFFLAAAVVAHPPALTAQHAGHQEMAPRPMMSSLFPGLLMSREGSGSSWQPDASPVQAWHVPAGAWTFMIHGGAFLRYTSQDAFRAGRGAATGSTRRTGS